MKRREVVVVGAGIIGLATTLALRDRGVDVLCLDSAPPGSGQSRGQTRIFRVAHRAPALAADALRARAMWHSWEERAGRQLIGDEGMLVVGEETAAARAAVLAGIGSAHELLTSRQVAARLAGYRTGEPALFDSTAGAIRARRTVEWLLGAGGSAVQRGLVGGLTPAGDRVVVHLDGDDVDAGRVIVCAGTATPALVAACGIDVVVDERPHHRVTLPCPLAGQPALVDDVTYSVPVGGRYQRAVGLSGDADALADDSPAAAIQRLREWCRRSWPLLDADPLEVLTCVTLAAPWLDGGDGFIIRRNGPLIAFNGANAFKFAPLIGMRLADAATA